MSALAENLFAKVSADAGVQAALGVSLAADVAFYPVRMPPGRALPAMVWFKVASSNNEPHSGVSPIDDSWLQISCYGTTYKQARDLRRAVRVALEAQTLASGEVMVDFTERDQFVDDTDAYHCILECHVLHDALAAVT
jgi:hypothetical protein